MHIRQESKLAIARPKIAHGFQGPCVPSERAGAEHLACVVGTQYAGISKTACRIGQFHANPIRFRASGFRHRCAPQRGVEVFPSRSFKTRTSEALQECLLPDRFGVFPHRAKSGWPVGIKAKPPGAQAWATIDAVSRLRAFTCYAYAPFDRTSILATYEAAFSRYIPRRTCVGRAF